MTDHDTTGDFICSAQKPRTALLGFIAILLRSSCLLSFTFLSSPLVSSTTPSSLLTLNVYNAALRCIFTDRHMAKWFHGLTLTPLNSSSLITKSIQVAMMIPESNHDHGRGRFLHTADGPALTTRTYQSSWMTPFGHVLSIFASHVTYALLLIIRSKGLF